MKIWKWQIKSDTQISINKDTKKLYLWLIRVKHLDWWNSGYFRVYPQPAVFLSATWWPPFSRNKTLLAWWTEAKKNVCTVPYFDCSAQTENHKLALFQTLFLNDFISVCLYTCTQIASVLLWFREVLTVNRNRKLKTLHQKMCERL